MAISFPKNNKTSILIVMNIVHYIIGIPPYRHGGAPAYAIDLLKQQSLCKDIHTSILLPGDISCFNHGSRIKTSKYKIGNIRCYKIINPTVSPLMYGLKKAEYILADQRKFSRKSLEKYYEDVRPDIIHVHTLMGLPKDFLSFMKAKGVKLVITSHDYYGLCPKVNLVDCNGQICQDSSGCLCAECNQFAKPKWLLRGLNSTFFLKVKKYLPRSAAKYRNQSNSSHELVRFSNDADSQFVYLKNYYIDMFSMFDAFHFNSNISKMVYEKSISLPYHEVIPITTGAINDRRKKKKFGKIVRMAFIAGLGNAKGFPMLKEILMKFAQNGFSDWCLEVWGGESTGTDEQLNNIEFKGRFSQSQLSAIYDSIDLVLVPSVWYETFSLVALEALSFGVPVLMSNHVGAQLLIDKIAPDFIFNGKEELKFKLKNIFCNPQILTTFNEKLLNSNIINFSETKHANDILEFYKRVIKL